MAEQRNGGESFMSVRDMVAEIRLEQKEMRAELALMRAEMAPRVVVDNHESRLRALEDARISLRGGWHALMLAASFIAGTTGLVLGVYTAL